MKKRIGCLIVVLLLTGILAACGSNSSNEAESSGDEVVIDFFHRWPNEPRKSFYDQKN